MMHHSGLGFGAGLFVFWLFGLAVVAGLIWLIYSLVLRAAEKWPRRTAPDDALEVARLRYARGEIGQDEFQRLVHDLTIKNR
jgi:uncharacterized membrane protein